MKRIGKRLATILCMVVAAGILSGCGGEDRVGYVDMTRVQKEAPLAQQYEQKIKDKGQALDQELKEAQQTMSAEDFQKKQQQAMQEQRIFASSMQRQLVSEMQSKMGEIAKEKEVGIILDKQAVPNGGIDLTDDVIAKLQ